MARIEFLRFALAGRALRNGTAHFKTRRRPQGRRFATGIQRERGNGDSLAFSRSLFVLRECTKEKKVQNPLVTKRQAAKLAKTDYSTVDYWVKMGWLPSIPINEKGWVKIPRQALERFLAEGIQQNPEPGKLGAA